jgi:hypothetical protein
MRLNVLAVLAAAVTSNATTVAVPATAPANAILVSPSFPGVSFELSTFSLYAQSRPPPHYSSSLPPVD